MSSSPRRRASLDLGFIRGRAHSGRIERLRLTLLGPLSPGRPALIAMTIETADKLLFDWSATERRVQIKAEDAFELIHALKHGAELAGAHGWLSPTSSQPKAVEMTPSRGVAP